MGIWKCAFCGRDAVEITSDYTVCLSKACNKKVRMKGGWMGNMPITEVVKGRMYEVGSESSTKVYDVNIQTSHCTCTDWATKRNKLVKAARAAGRPDESVVYACKHVNAAKQYAGVSAETDRTHDAAMKRKAAADAKAVKRRDDIIKSFKKAASKDSVLEQLKAAVSKDA